MARGSADNKLKIVRKFPSSENGPGVHCITTTGQEYFITQCLERMRFTLWRKVENGYEQISTAKSPLDLDDKIPWDK